MRLLPTDILAQHMHASLWFSAQNPRVQVRFFASVLSSKCASTRSAPWHIVIRTALAMRAY